MRSLHLFWQFLKESSSEVLLNKHLYISAFFALILLGNAESLWPFLGVGAESTTSIVLTVVVAIFTFVILAQVVLIQKKKHGGEGELSFIVPTFLLYNLYYTMVFFAALALPIALFYIPFVGWKLNTHFFGLILFYLFIGLTILGAFVVNVTFFMVPLIAVLDDEVTGKFFKASRALVKKNFHLVSWISLFTLLLEFSFLAFSFISDPLMKVWATFLYSFLDSFLTLVFTVAMVKIFYHLKNS